MSERGATNHFQATNRMTATASASQTRPIVSQAGNTTGYGSPLLDVSVLPDYTAVYSGVDIHVTYAAAATFGALLMAAASGQVTPFTGTTYSQIVGRCTQPGGVAAGATVARARIF